MENTEGGEAGIDEGTTDDWEGRNFQKIFKSMFG